MLRHCELFGGCGGFTHAAEKYYPGRYETLEYCDIDEQAIAIYSNKFPGVRIHRDIKDYFPKPEQFDIITCTFPCTGTSSAGSRTGLAHPESALWREGFRIMCEVRPKYFVWEQPMGAIHRGVRSILGGCRVAGYHTKLIPIRAKTLGAAHQRDRLFIIAYLDDRQRYNEERWENQARIQAEKIRNSSRWLSVKSRSNGNVHGFSVGLVRSGNWAEINQNFYLVPNGLRRRNDARRIAGKTVTPAQAAIALSFVNYLEEESRTATGEQRESVGMVVPVCGKS